MIVCASCGTGLRDDSRFCDRCGAQLEARGYQPQYAPPALTYVPFDLILQALTYVVQTWNQLDVQQKIEILRLAGEAAAGSLLAVQELHDWWESRKRLDQRQWQ
jgi:hypothetical protein